MLILYACSTENEGRKVATVALLSSHYNKVSCFRTGCYLHSLACLQMGS